MKVIRKVFSIVTDCHTTHGHYGSLWRRHFYDGLRKVVDHLITPEDLDFNWARQPQAGSESAVQQERGRCAEQLWQQIQYAQRRIGLDAVLSYCFARDLDLDLIVRSIKHGITWINFYCDSTHRFGEVEALAKLVSLNWFPERAAIPRYRALGVAFLCQPYALNPDHLPDLSCHAAQHLVGFVGLPTGNRITQMGCLRLLGCPVAIRGHGWVCPMTTPFHNPNSGWIRRVKALAGRGFSDKIARRCFWPLVRRQAGPGLNENEFVEFVRGCRIILGLNQGRDENGWSSSYLKFRDIEFPGYGCCYLTGHNQDVAGVFDVGREILTYHDIPEAAARIREMRREPECVHRIGLAGRQRVLSSHTWEARIKQLAEAL